MRAGIYIRVSTEEQAHYGFSLAEQREACRKKAKELGAAEILEFADEGISGATLERPGLEALRQAIKENLIDLFIVRDPDRFSRKLAHQLLLTEEFERAGVKLEFLDFTWQDTPEGRLFYSIKGAVAEYEREKIRERMSRGKMQKARQGGIPMGFTLYGYDYSSAAGVTINDQEAEVVNYMFKQIVSFHSAAQIAVTLNQNGIPTKKNTGYWHRQVVRQILMNPAYKGEWNYGKKHEQAVIIPIPAIVSAELWGQAQERLNAARRLWTKKSKRQYLLSGLVTCSDCGTPMGGVYAKYWGEHYRGYTCRKSKSASRRSGCEPAKIINAASLEHIVWQQAKLLLSDVNRLTAAIRENLPDKFALANQLERLEKKQAEIKKGRNVLIEALTSGLLNLDADTRKKLDALNYQENINARQYKELEAKLHGHQNSEQDNELPSRAEKMIEAIDLLDFEDKKKLIRALITQVIITGRTRAGYHQFGNLPGIKVVITFRTEPLPLLSSNV